MPGFTPAPASQELKAQLWCSRPLASAVLLNGVRPNSVVQTTSVSSSRPRGFRSLQQARDRLIDVLRQPRMVQHVAVRIPVAGRAGIDQFDKPHTAFDQPPGHQALPGEALRAAARQAVQRQGRVGFLLQIERLRHGHLHAERRLEGTDPGRQQRVLGTRGQVPAIEPRQRGQFQFLPRAGDPRRDVRHRFGARDHQRALMAPGQEIAGVDLRAGIRSARGRSRRTTAGCGSRCPGRS